MQLDLLRQLDLPMASDLPITIKIAAPLMASFKDMQLVTETLAAQLNFQTLTAGWYGHEDDILTIQLIIDTEKQFSTHKASQHQGQLTKFSDDVMSFFQADIKQIACYIAITDGEKKLLLEREKIMKAFMRTKLEKVLNLIAVQQSLPQI